MPARIHPCVVVERAAPHTDPAFATVLSRARAEFLEMPGLKLTCAQAARLWSLDARTCAAVLTALVDARFLIETPNASFTRA